MYQVKVGATKINLDALSARAAATEVLMMNPHIWEVKVLFVCNDKLLSIRFDRRNMIEIK